jgi:vacuolar-type H+-ATPase subunit D/Vma8
MSPMDNDDKTIQQLAQLDSKLDLIEMKMDELKERQEDMAKDIAKVRESVYHPDDGLYARLRELEAWQKTSSKVIWMVVSSMIGIVAYIITKNLS